MNKELLNELNAAYCRLEMKKAEIVRVLLHRIFELESGWYNGHYHRNEAGEWNREAYGVEDYLADYYQKGQTNF